MGGPVTAGSPYIVGERGPELFVPSQGGGIVPNHAMAGGGVTVNISAVDAKGVRRLLLDNNGAVAEALARAIRDGRA
jgi:phage-related minor tail protein